MDLHQLRAFCTVSEELNLTRAAEKLFTSQPALTRKIKNLENELGSKLFTRGPRGLVLTRTGQMFYEYVTQILDKLEASVANVRRMELNQKQLFSIGFGPSLFYGELPQLIRRLKKRKDVEIRLMEMSTFDQVEALKASRIDIGFGRLEIDDPEIEQQVLFQVPMMAALPIGHPLNGKRPSLAELAEYPLVVFPATHKPGFAVTVINLFRKAGLKARVTQEVNEVQTALSLVASDVGIALVPEQVSYIQRAGISYVYLEDASLTTPVICSRRRNDPPNDVMDQAMTTLAGMCAERLLRLQNNLG